MRPAEAVSTSLLAVLRAFAWGFLFVRHVSERAQRAPGWAPAGLSWREGPAALSWRFGRRHHALFCSRSRALFLPTIRCRRFVDVTKNRPTGLAKQNDDATKLSLPYADGRALIFTSPSTSSAASKIRQWRECERR